ncbi:DEAD/DEAH box helicase [Sphingomonas sp. IBVSS1]|nr:DEAD/DEAH box helicase [Sphingomonas sp. IBVSS1]
MNFSDLALAEPIARALNEKGYAAPSPIQAAAIPPALAGHDVLGLAQTGTGKTAAFALPMLHRLAADPKHRIKMNTRALVLAPTRELASQIAASFQAYGKYMRLSVAVVFGGVPIGRQERALAPGVDVLVATPGRLLDLVMKGACDLGRVEMLVLDECDQMLDLGFIHDLKRITGLLPKQRQSMLFSATLAPAIEQLAERYLKSPVKVAVQPAATTVEKVVQSVVHVSQPEKLALLAHLLDQPEVASSIVFTRTKHGADRVVRQLAAHGLVAEAIHGNRSQPQRTRALDGFRAGTLKILVATDIAARGLDIPAVSHVFNFELPNVPEQYVHRIGRTARAGRAGVAIALCAPDERPYLKDIEKTIRMALTQAPLPANFRDLVGKTAKLIKSNPVAAEPPREERDFARSRNGGRPGRDPRAVVHAEGRRDGAPRREGPREERREFSRDGQPRREGQPRRDGGQPRPAGGRPQGRPGGGFAGRREGQRRSPAGR